MDLNELYTELISEHNQNKENKRHIENPDHIELGHNPSCGDEISLELKFDGDIIKDAAFTGHGCAISQASTSIMIDLIKGKKKEEALKLVDMFLAMIKKDIKDDNELEELEDAIAFKNISNMPARVKCAVLSWHTLKESINE
ncbi:Fe-S cluster assembly sulfur transfer protein SufU [Clostridium algidicarnis]|uniref:Modular FeS cluster scaffolding protein NifU n=2 Tax=Clostridium algidicarnis TaxID=37659 RepID=A0A2S6FVP4_9CLOT|nr:SUF system NifU family Fe-S cluster assembly protein [Clostridium algidicarnis]MBU3197277.1 SUF system NifU family Fe-S cluster assembly protein [Clostridium algidicarnis]MBU3220438.1 SUF system NifU family Fe-S cluster assembly protein [Clostridium algidicarnis]PPK46916.1 modular FeS cluster scaffolding protein NifU [Clostridium algidicarnis DSM 15099]